MTESKYRWAAASGYTEEDMAGLTSLEMDEFDRLTFQKYGPDQVTFGTHDEAHYNQLLKKIEDYSK